jgi:hypothetical protein
MTSPSRPNPVAFNPCRNLSAALSRWCREMVDTVREVLREGWVTLLVGAVGVMLILALWCFEAPPQRDLAVELRTFFFTYPPIALMTAVHVRRRLPHLLRPALQLFVLAMLVRTACLVVDHSYELRTQPSSGGFGYPDSLGYAVKGLIMGQILRGDATPPSRELNYQGFPTFTQEAAVRLDWGGVWYLDLSTIMCLQYLLFGFSVVASGIPHLLLGAFFVVQATILAAKWANGRYVGLLALWLALAPEFVVFGIWLHKDQGLAILMLYIVEWFAPGRPPRLPVLLFNWAKVAAIGYTLREYTLALYSFLTVYLYWRVSKRGARWALLDAALFLLIAMRARDAIGYQAKYLAIFGIVGEKDILAGVLRNLLMPSPAGFVDETRAILSSEALWEGLLAVVWPSLLVLLLIGQWRILAGTSRVPLAVGVVFWSWFIILSANYSGMSGSIRHRMIVESLAMIIALETLDWLRDRPPRTQRTVALIAVVSTAVIWLRAFAGTTW